MVSPGMRRYLQGTLDFCCGIYAVLNALSCLYSIDLNAGRTMFRETLLEFSACENVWRRFLANDTDHYWVVRHMLGRWCSGAYAATVSQPFSDALAIRDESLRFASMYLPENDNPEGPDSLADCYAQAAEVWGTLRSELPRRSRGNMTSGRVGVLRFHRFLPGVPQPVVSHWTTVKDVTEQAVMLHDASAEQGALFTLDKGTLMPFIKRRPLVRIVPESIVILSRV